MKRETRIRVFETENAVKFQVQLQAAFDQMGAEGFNSWEPHIVGDKYVIAFERPVPEPDDLRPGGKA